MQCSKIRVLVVFLARGGIAGSRAKRSQLGDRASPRDGYPARSAQTTQQAGKIHVARFNCFRRGQQTAGGLGNGFCVRLRPRTRGTQVAMDRNNRWSPGVGTSGRLRRNAQTSRPFPLGRNIGTPPVRVTETCASGLAASKIGIESQYRNAARLIKVQFTEC